MPVYKNRNELIISHFALVKKYARKACGRSDSMYKDLCQDGYEGLIHAADKYDPSLGVPFHIYAKDWINQYIKMGRENHSRNIRIPERKISELSRIFRYMSDHPNADTSEIAEATGLEESKVLLLRDYTHDELSLDVRAFDGDEEERSLGSLCFSRSNTENEAINNILIENLYDAVDSLSEREKEIVVGHFGLKGKERETLESLAMRNSITKERARQIEKAALLKCRSMMER